MISFLRQFGSTAVDIPGNRHFCKIVLDRGNLVEDYSVECGFHAAASVLIRTTVLHAIEAVLHNLRGKVLQAHGRVQRLLDAVEVGLEGRATALRGGARR